MSDQKKSTVISIVTLVCVMSVGVVGALGVFAKEQMWIAIPVVGCLALMGTIVGAMAARNRD